METTTAFETSLHEHLNGAITIVARFVIISICKSLHAVQFGNNWMKKITRTAKIGRGHRPSPIWLSEEFFESNYFQIGQACSPLTY